MKWNRTINGFLVIMILVLLAILFTCYPSKAIAKDAPLEITFTMESPEVIDHYELYCITVPGSGTKVLMGTLTSSSSVIWNIEEAVWDVNILNIPPGKTLDWYLHSIDMEGDIGYSPAYQFKLTGNPNIRSIRLIK